MNLAALQAKWAGLLVGGALLSSLLWFLFWTTLDPVAGNVQDKVNWYFFMKLHLGTVRDVFGVFRLVGRFAPLAVGVALILWHWNTLGALPLLFMAALTLYNVALVVALVVTGQLILSLFVVVYPIRLAFLLRSGWWPLVTLPTFANIFLGLYHCCSSPANKRTSVLRALPLRVLVALGVHVGVALLVLWVTHSGCAPCGPRLQPRPFLVGHRGCSHSAPENTMAAFRRAVLVPEVKVLESDVAISYDGVPFLLHDPHAIRTTDIEQRCPTVDPAQNASWLGFTSGPCPLSELNAGRFFVEELAVAVSEEDSVDFSDEKVATLAQLLSVVRDSGNSIIVDITEPPVGHPYHSSYLNLTLKVLNDSGVDHSKVWWLAPYQRKWVRQHYPRMVQTAKSKDTSFEEFLSLHIQKVNDDWSTSLATLRRYQEANLSINMFFVESVFMLDYAWCIGVQSVTTSDCKTLAKHSHNHFYQVCHELRELQTEFLLPLTLTLAMCSASCLICSEYLGKRNHKR